MNTFLVTIRVDHKAYKFIVYNCADEIDALDKVSRFQGSEAFTFISIAYIGNADVTITEVY